MTRRAGRDRRTWLNQIALHTLLPGDFMLLPIQGRFSAFYQDFSATTSCALALDVGCSPPLVI
eukprot:342231-Pelagomonas_calceolata.AAC.3